MRSGANADELREAELAYALRRDCWGAGYVSEAAPGLVATGFRQLGLHRVFATCNLANQGSIRVLKKLGMPYEGCLRRQKWCRERWRDVAVYAVPAADWQDPLRDQITGNFQPSN